MDEDARKKLNETIGQAFRDSLKPQPTADELRKLGEAFEGEFRNLRKVIVELLDEIKAELERSQLPVEVVTSDGFAAPPPLYDERPDKATMRITLNFGGQDCVQEIEFQGHRHTQTIVVAVTINDLKGGVTNPRAEFTLNQLGEREINRCANAFLNEIRPHITHHFREHRPDPFIKT